jgi:hypothetical protein
MFTQENTEGYEDFQLNFLNLKMSILSKDVSDEQYLKYISENLLTEFDTNEVNFSESNLKIIGLFESNFEAEQLEDTQSIINFLEDGEAIAKFYNLETVNDEDDQDQEVMEEVNFLHSYYENKLEQERVTYNRFLISKCNEYREQLRAAQKGVQEESLISKIRDELYKQFPFEDHHGIYEDISEYIKSNEFWA